MTSLKCFACIRQLLAFSFVHGLLIDVRSIVGSEQSVKDLKFK